jgi:hypothetical protein
MPQFLPHRTRLAHGRTSRFDSFGIQIPRSKTAPRTADQFERYQLFSEQNDPTYASENRESFFRAP